MADDKLSFTDHLEELRKRLIICLIAVGIGFSLSYSFAEKLFQFLAAPLYKQLPGGSTFIFTGLTDAFFTISSFLSLPEYFLRPRLFYTKSGALSLPVCMKMRSATQLHLLFWEPSCLW